jgi:surface polysaccharide O-acyltransferase-like enzyme
MSTINNQRHYGFEILRVFACYMVIQIHTGEFYYIGNGGTVINSSDSHYVGWYNSLFRICVPLFVMLSGYYLFPVNNTKSFFQKRLSRVAVPFIVWCIVYAFYYYFIGATNFKTTLINITHIPLNFGVEIGHLWFVYMLMGIYLFAPIISDWVQNSSRKNLEFYLLLWALTLMLPYIHLIFPAVWGECYWNRTPMLYYFSGFLGYVILANYIKRFHSQPRAFDYILGITFIIIGYTVTTYGFLHLLPIEKSTSALELTWGFETINVAMMTAGFFMIMKNVQIEKSNVIVMRLLFDLSAKSYGIYLAHIIVLNGVHEWLDPIFMSAAIKLPLVAITTFGLTYAIVKALSYLPKSKWLIG